MAEPVDEIRTSEDVVVSKVGRELYEKFFCNYSRKQWGLDPSELDASVTSRVPTRTNRDDRYFTEQVLFLSSQTDNDNALRQMEEVLKADIRPSMEVTFAEGSRSMEPLR